MQTDLIYTVAPRDCLWNLAKQHYGNPFNWPAIFEYNNHASVTKITGSRIINPDLILIGQTLIIPGDENIKLMNDGQLGQPSNAPAAPQPPIVKPTPPQADVTIEDRARNMRQRVRNVRDEHAKKRAGTASVC